MNHLNYYFKIQFSMPVFTCVRIRISHTSAYHHIDISRGSNRTTAKIFLADMVSNLYQGLCSQLIMNLIWSLYILTWEDWENLGLYCLGCLTPSLFCVWKVVLDRILSLHTSIRLLNNLENINGIYFNKG